MKLQSAIEFLSTYGFMFLLVIMILALIFYFIAPVQNAQQNQCTIFGSLVCNFVIYHTQQPTSNANVIFSVSNSGSAPVNILVANVILNSKTFTGSCNPTLLSPGASSICNAITTPYEPVGTQMHGYISITLNYCNSQVSQFGNSLSQANCTYTPLTYTGEFFSYSSLVTANSVSTTSTSTLPPLN